MSFYIDSQLLEAFKKEVADLDFNESVFKIEHAEMWVRIAISDHTVAEQIYKLCTETLNIDQALDDSLLLNQAMALHYIRALGARHLLPLVFERLSTCRHLNKDVEDCWFFTINPLNQSSHSRSEWADHVHAIEKDRDGLSYFAPLISVYSAVTMGETALNLMTDLALNSDPIKAKVYEVVNAHLNEEDELQAAGLNKDKLLTWLWDNWQSCHQEDILLEIVAKCVENRTDRLETLAIRLALMTPELAEQICRLLTRLPLEQKQFFARNLEKQLKRVSKVKLWVYCRTALFAK